jgi:hypothetical protein
MSLKYEPASEPLHISVKQKSTSVPLQRIYPFLDSGVVQGYLSHEKLPPLP